MERSFEQLGDEHWSADERETYEQECLRETRDQLTRVLASSSEQQELRELRLEGIYPDTRILLELWDARFDRDVKRAYSIWKHPIFVTPLGIREPPNQVGLLIATWSLGG